MKKIIALFILIIPLVQAAQFSPTKLEFILAKDTLECKKINFELDSPAIMNDVWASSSAQPWSVTDFKTASEELKINIAYSRTINLDQNEARICISGSNPGEYHGALVVREEEVGNSIMQYAIWLKLSIEGSQNSDDADTSSSSRSSKKSRPTNADNEETPEKKVKKQTTVQNLSFKNPQEEIKLNNPISFDEQEISQDSMIQILTMPALFATTILVLLLYKNQKTLKSHSKIEYKGQLDN
jgi:hypothetical protein